MNNQAEIRPMRVLGHLRYKWNEFHNPKPGLSVPHPVAILDEILAEEKYDGPKHGKVSKKEQERQFLSMEGASDSSVNAPFRIQRLWSEADEIVILKRMIEFMSMKKSNLVTFHDFIKGRLHVEVSREQLTRKVGKLKKRYDANIIENHTFSEEAFELCQKLWGSKSTMKSTQRVQPDVREHEDLDDMDLADGTLEEMAVKKRSISSFQHVNGVEMSKRKKGVHFQKRTCASNSSPIVNPVTRFWNDADEIVILKGMVDYLEVMKNSTPIYSSLDFYDFVRENLRVNASQQQLTRKIRTLKDRYKRNKFQNRTLSNDAFQLCKKIWDGETIVKEHPTIEVAAVDHENNEDIGNMNVEDGAQEKMALRTDVGSYDVNVEDNVLSLGAELFEEEDEVDGAEEWRKLLIEEMEINQKELDIKEIKLVLMRKELEVEEMKVHLKNARAKLVITEEAVHEEPAYDAQCYNLYGRH